MHAVAWLVPVPKKAKYKARLGFTVRIHMALCAHRLAYACPVKVRHSVGLHFLMEKLYGTVHADAWQVEIGHSVSLHFSHKKWNCAVQA